MKRKKRDLIELLESIELWTYMDATDPGFNEAFDMLWDKCYWYITRLREKQREKDPAKWLVEEKQRQVRFAMFHKDMEKIMVQETSPAPTSDSKNIVESVEDFLRSLDR